MAICLKSKKERTRMCIECECRTNKILRKKMIRSSGKHRFKIGARSELCCYLPSLLSITYVASLPIRGSSLRNSKLGVIPCGISMANPMVHFAVAWSVAKPLNRSEAKGDLVMLQTLLLLSDEIQFHYPWDRNSNFQGGKSNKSCNLIGS